VTKNDSRAVGYSITVLLAFNNTNPAVLGFLDEFCAQHDIEPILRKTESSNRLEINKRGDIQKFLKLVRSSLIARHTETEILLQHLLPGLELGKSSSKEGFVTLMGYVDRIREETPTRVEPKYDQAYFREEWGL
jgi:hypothetical protein